MSHPYPPSLNDAGDWSFNAGCGVLMVPSGLLLLTLLRKRNTAVHALSESTDPQILEALATVAGGDGPLSRDDWAPKFPAEAKIV